MPTISNVDMPPNSARLLRYNSASSTASPRPSSITELLHHFFAELLGKAELLQHTLEDLLLYGVVHPAALRLRFVTAHKVGRHQDVDVAAWPTGGLDRRNLIEKSSLPLGELTTG